MLGSRALIRRLKRRVVVSVALGQGREVVVMESEAEQRNSRLGDRVFVAHTSQSPVKRGTGHS
jgi:hypothetical protein